LAIKGRYYFTVGYGVRYEIFFPQRERLNKIATFEDGQSGNPRQLF
jgi:hypothetical protein